MLQKVILGSNIACFVLDSDTDNLSFCSIGGDHLKNYTLGELRRAIVKKRKVPATVCQSLHECQELILLPVCEWLIMFQLDVTLSNPFTYEWVESGQAEL